jgi:hypothetical protein
MSTEDIHSAAAGKAPQQPIPPRRRGWFRRNWLWFVPTLILAVVVVGGAVLYWALFLRIYNHPLCRSAMQSIAADKDLLELLGQPIQTVKWPSQQVAPSARIEEREIEIRWHIEGSKRRAKAYLKARLGWDEKWEIIQLEVFPFLPDGKEGDKIVVPLGGENDAPAFPAGKQSSPTTGTKSGPKMLGSGQDVNVPTPPDDPPNGEK